MITRHYNTISTFKTLRIHQFFEQTLICEKKKFLNRFLCVFITQYDFRLRFMSRRLSKKTF